jgi:hypothetical protein
MNALAILNAALQTWRPKAEQRHGLLVIEEFLNRHRARLLGVIEHELSARRIRRGRAPRTPADWSEVDQLVLKERTRPGWRDDDPTGRAALLQKLSDRVTEAPPDQQERLARRARTYVDLRAEAILLRAKGQAAEPLLLRYPVLALLSGDGAAVIALRDAKGVLHENPAYPGASALQNVFDAAHQRVAQIRDQIADGARLDRYANALWSRTAADVTPSAPTVEIESPPDLKDKPWRTEANLQAMRLVMAKEPGEMTSGDLQILTRYSGWGGLSIDKVQDQFPADLVPESFGLIHEYYTPTVIADSLAEVLCPFLPELAGRDGIVRALEPSAGIGRLIRAFTPRRCLALEAGGQIKRIEWTAVEFSKVSSTLLRALRGDINVFHMPFERWVREEGSRYHGTLGLILSNPPYGERGAFAREDRDEFYFEKRAYAYFMRRALDLLIPGGIGVFLIPAVSSPARPTAPSAKRSSCATTSSAPTACPATTCAAARTCRARGSSWTSSSGATAAASSARSTKPTHTSSTATISSATPRTSSAPKMEPSRAMKVEAGATKSPASCAASRPSIRARSAPPA